MNEEKINQILKNQGTILKALYERVNSRSTLFSISDRMDETKTILNPQEQPKLPERTKDALRGEGVA